LLELPALHRDGREIVIEMTLSPVRDGPADQRFALAVIRDVTARRRAEEALREAERRAARLQTTAEMGVTVAHELNQPLSEVVGYLELLQAGRFKPEEQAEIYARMGRAAATLQTKIRTIEGLRDYVTKTYGEEIIVVDLERSGSPVPPDAAAQRSKR
jgi:signal transduction histidine kinase